MEGDELLILGVVKYRVRSSPGEIKIRVNGPCLLALMPN